MIVRICDGTIDVHTDFVDDVDENSLYSSKELLPRHLQTR